MDNQADQTWDSLREIVPELSTADPEEKKTIKGLVRRSLILAKAEEKLITTILSADDSKTLAEIIHSIEVKSEMEILQHIEELALTPEEQEEETIHWAFRNQTVSGEFLIRDELVAFRFIYLNNYFKIVLSQQNCPEVSRAFEKIFNKPFDLFSNKAFQIEGKTWIAWAWINYPDTQQNHNAIEKMRTIWETLGQ